ncbi:GntR family transcriptional regulator [Mesorhizobium sp. CAU 1732]|uniref:GntR family transcriptional regulator n=1 Tax=Mesorhizobium sp. CAU 1732 TaxID=3140358 RepID=UPI0032613474
MIDKPGQDEAGAGATGQARLSSSDQIVRDIVRGLYEGRYVAGQRLVEPDLMRRYAVSRSTVREAIKRLAAEGVVALHAFRGAQIRHLTRRDAQSVLVVLEVMIGLAARLAAETIDAPGVRAHFTAAYEALAAFSEERDSYDLVRARNRFYRVMAQIGGNDELRRLLPSFQVHLIRTHLRTARADRFSDYQLMAEAILAGDGTAAEIAGRRHIRRSIEAMREAPDAIFAPERTDPSSSYSHEDSDHA